MIVDTSAWIAILKGEPDVVAFTHALEHAPVVRTSVVTVLEATIVAGASRRRDLDDLLLTAGAEIVPFDRRQLELAQQAHKRYGRGGGSKARLNFGDCCTYALAKATGEPLLFNGDDFTHTDLRAAG